MAPLVDISRQDLQWMEGVLAGQVPFARIPTRLIGWHALRHSFASQLAMAGVPILTIKELMGHSTIQMTMRYAHLAPSTLAEAVPALLRAEALAVAANCHSAVTNALVSLSHPQLLASSMAQISA